MTATSADLHAVINAHGTDTTYHFEYGVTTEYGASTQEIDIGSSLEAQALLEHIDNLQSAVYHFRVVAHNALGTSVSKDQTFTFYPPPCPNQTLRQQNGSSYLPDCRAYELVTPADAGNVTLAGGGRAGPFATDPARVSFGGKWGAVSGTNPTNGTIVDSYVSTRTGTGWTTAYPGVEGDKTIAGIIQSGSLTLDKIYSANLPQEALFITTSQPADNIPYIFGADGSLLGRWPANTSSVSNSEKAVGVFSRRRSSGHMAFSSFNIDFDPNGDGLELSRFGL